MSFPELLLTELAQEKQLTERETEVFLALFGQGKTRTEIAERLHVQETAVSTCLSGIYRKFGISARGPVKESRLKDELKRRETLWQQQKIAKTSSTLPTTSSSQSIDADIIAQVREHCRQKILSLHSRMRLLSGEEIGVDQLYVDVWLLNRSPRTFQVTQDKLLQTFDLRNDRLGLGDRIKRKQSFEVANANTKLVILGKPGAGKTTFLKHLAVDWSKGQFQPHLIAVFLELRRIRNSQWRLLDAIGKELGLDEGEQIRVLKKQIQQLQRNAPKSTEEKQTKEDQIQELKQKLEALSLRILLKEGKLLVLMDGLDEVPTSELRRNVQDQLREIIEQYASNRWILTCRTQIIASIPEGFTSVEVADFSAEQVQQFVQNWFRASGQSAIEISRDWVRFNSAVNKNLALKELTVTPVLLSLMCLVFHDEGEMPSQMTDLYNRGIRLLLEKWNDVKEIEGWKVSNDMYRELSVEQKEALLIEIAARKFENPKNFVLFQQNELTAQIVEFLHLANRHEGVAVLKAMEAQHGLLIERADELWSFSHLTFQEHFTIQWLTRLTSEQLAEKIANPRWQRVVEQLVTSQQPADRLVRLIKQSIDRSISGGPEFSKFLTWSFQKAVSVHADYEPAALRAIYFARTRAHALDLGLARALDLARAFDFSRALNPAFDFALDFTLDLALDLALSLACTCSGDLTLDLNLALDLDHDLALDLNLVLDLDLAFDRALALDSDFALALAHDFALDSDLAHNRDLARNSDFALRLERLRKELPSPEDRQHFQQWWQTQGQQWVEHLRHAMIEHRNIGHNWQFSDQQKQQLQRYYDANHFLVKLMQIYGAVSYEVKTEIEDSLLLPWDELQRRYPEIYS